MHSFDLMLDNILIPTDGSVPSERAAEFGVRLAKLSHGKVHALYVADTSKILQFGGSVFPFNDVSPSTINEASIGLQSFARKEGEMATEFVEGLARDLGVPCERMVIEGYPASEILRVAKEDGMDLVVMGSIGRTGSEEVLLGGVAGRVVRNSAVPVLVVPGDSCYASSSAANLKSNNLNNILTPTDGSDHSERAAELGVRLAKLSHGKVHALYVADTSKLVSLLGSSLHMDDIDSNTAQEASSGLRGFALKEGEKATQLIDEFARDSGVPCERMVVEGYPASEILRVAKEDGMDLIVMGSIGRTGLGKVYLGGVAGKVVRNSVVPVLVVPANKSQ
jgi:nucleotide-binding universal stress UspA family protein